MSEALVRLKDLVAYGDDGSIVADPVRVMEAMKDLKAVWPKHFGPHHFVQWKETHDINVIDKEIKEGIALVEQLSAWIEETKKAVVFQAKQSKQ